MHRCHRILAARAEELARAHVAPCVRSFNKNAGSKYSTVVAGPSSNNEQSKHVQEGVRIHALSRASERLLLLSTSFLQLNSQQKEWKIMCINFERRTVLLASGFPAGAEDRRDRSQTMWVAVETSET
jgi:hypothetical protein